jgi:hypothetical protein
VKHIQEAAGVRLQLKGRGSGYVENSTGREADEPLHIWMSTTNGDAALENAKSLLNDLLSQVKSDYDVWKQNRRSGNSDRHSREDGYRGDRGDRDYPYGQHSHNAMPISQGMPQGHSVLDVPFQVPTQVAPGIPSIPAAPTPPTPSSDIVTTPEQYAQYQTYFNQFYQYYYHEHLYNTYQQSQQAQIVAEPEQPAADPGVESSGGDNTESHPNIKDGVQAADTEQSESATLEGETPSSIIEEASLPASDASSFPPTMDYTSPEYAAWYAQYYAQYQNQSTAQEGEGQEMDATSEVANP